jgi:phosphate ABC transporter phosphate-binding protein
MFVFLRLFLIVVIGAGLGLLVYYSPAFFNKEQNPSLPQLKTGGTSGAYHLVENGWRRAYRKDKQVELTYESTGSTEGIKRMIDKSLTVCFSHAPMTPEQKKTAQETGGEVVQIPVVVFAVVPIYKIKELRGKPPLNLNADVLAGIFLGDIKKWNDPPIRKLNPDVELPERDIVVVHRADSSGTTLVFTEYLQASKAWRDAMGKPASVVKWRVGDAVERNIGVVNKVFTTEDSIGYVDLLFAQHNNYPFEYAAVRNKDDNTFIHAETKHLQAAINQVLPTIPENLDFKLTNLPGTDSYPICGVIWASCYQNQPAGEVKKVEDFLTWILHDGQQTALSMSYAPLPEELIERAAAMTRRVKAAP